MGLAWASPVGLQAATREHRWGGPTKAPLSHAAARIATPRHHCTHCSVPALTRFALYTARQIQSVAPGAAAAQASRWPAWVPRQSSAVRLARLGILCVDEGWWGFMHVPALPCLWSPCTGRGADAGRGGQEARLTGPGHEVQAVSGITRRPHGSSENSTNVIFEFVAIGQL